MKLLTPILFILLFANVVFCNSLGLKDFTDLGGYTFQVSIVKRETAEMLFSEMAGQSHIPFKAAEQACWSRAHEMSMLMEKMGYLTGKAFLEGDLKLETPEGFDPITKWGNHVAPFILVLENDRLVEYVIDPSVSNELMSAVEWETKMTKHEGGRTDRKFFTSRFHYTRYSQYGAKTYLQSDIDDTKANLSSYLGVQNDRLLYHSKRLR